MKGFGLITVLCFLLLAGIGSGIQAQTVDSLQAPPVSPAHKQPAKAANSIKGVVVDKLTREPVPFATVFFPYSPVGTATDTAGFFSLQYDKPPYDTLRVQVIGYNTLSIPLRRLKTAGLVLELEQSTSTLSEVVINAGEDPALILLRKIIARKPVNDPEQVNTYSCEAYNKIEIDVLNLTKEQFEKMPVPYIKHFSFIYNNLDTTSGDKPFLPFFLVETLSDYYYQKQPKKSREVIKANQIRGIKNESITQYMGRMHLAINPYDNYLLFFDKQFVSPLSNMAAAYYKYRITDTLSIDGHSVLSVSFRPQRPGENCFTGVIHVVDSVYALQYFKAEIPATANINWIKNAVLYKEYAQVDSTWFCVKDNVTAELILSQDVIKLPGLMGHKTTTYRNVKLNDETVPAIISGMKEEVKVADTARNRSEEFWKTVRHDTLSKNEKAIYQMFDTLEKDRTYNRFKNLVKFLATGVKEVGPLELGPYWSLYSNNIVEGNRFRFSMGTTKKFSKDMYLNGYVAYGTKDKKYKYNLSGLWLLQRQPRAYLFASYTRDIDRRTNYYDKVSFDNVVNLAIRKNGIPFKFVFVNEGRLEFCKYYYNGFSHKLTGVYKTFNPYDPLPSATIFKDDNGNTTSTIANTEVDLQVRYAYKERFLEGNYYRVSLGSKYPIVDAHFAMGFKGLLGGGYDYKKLTLTVSDEIKIAPLGTLYLNVFGGKYFGTLPYLLLENHPGNENYYYNKYAFNMMNNFEFLSDQYAGFNIQHSLGAGMFKYIPGVKKLKLRQFWTAKGVIGSLNDANSNLNLDKGYAFRTLENAPYVEVGTGIENILRLFRIDFVWRVLPQLLPNEPKQKHFGIFGSVKVNF